MSTTPLSATVPLTKVGASWFTLFSVAWLVIWTAQLTPLQLLLPLQLDTPDSGTGWVSGVVSSGLVLGVGGLAGVVAGPIAGALSDRRNGSQRRRRPFALAGVWITSVCLLLTGWSEGPLAIGASWVGVSVGIAIASAAFTAMIADQLPPQQWGAASSSASSAQAVGIVVGVGTVVLLGLGVFEGYLVLAIAMAVLGTAASLLLPDPVNKALGGAATRQHNEPRFAFLQDRDFMWMLSGRLTVNIGNALGTALFLFFLMYGIGQHRAEAEDNLLLIIVVYTVFVVGASVVAGLVSDRLQRRRSLTILAALVQAVSGILITVSPTFTMTLVAAALMGVGYGAFMTVGLAFATDLLPSGQNNARDLGVVNVIAALGQLLGPIIGAGLVALVGGFWLVFAAAALLSLIGAALTALAREQRAT
ncbi:MFS transporter [Leucobacter viscericola]|uniref:MFS transporter n=1 Tax=Leucobacter viscericola TaxID=2714935 RepID=A0A6G7XIH4_9MICO|nr:MFS transporter [Leucobacter viscericola]QIK64168.1 MFS transporter [Leucobacter viscericola]